MTKKIIISQPMRGKTEEQIREERAALVDELTQKGYEVVNTIFPGFINEGNIPLKYLAKSLDAIADVDAVYFMDGWDEARGCYFEFQACKDYGIQTFMSDAYAVSENSLNPNQIFITRLPRS